MTILETHDLRIGYAFGRQRPPKVVADSLTLTLEAGEFVCLLGPNGAGKSTLLRTIAGVQSPLAGDVLLNGAPVHRLNPSELARRLSIVLTERAEVGMLTGYALVALGRYPYTDWMGRLTAQDEAVVHWAVTAVGAQDIAPRFVHELSDGERQKLMIARALAQEPALMILDEPTAFLDLPRRVEIMHLLRNLARETGRSILLSTHDLDLALRTADRLWLLAKDGMMHTGTPEDLILNGAFERAFRGEGVEFDVQTGIFRISQKATASVIVEGESLAALWTRRALERAGYTLVENGAAPLARIEILDGERPCWLVIGKQTRQECGSVQEVLSLLARFAET